MTSQGDNRFYREQQAADQELRYDEDGLHIYWVDPVEGCWVAFRRVDCVGEEELSERRLPRFEQSHTPTNDEREALVKIIDSLTSPGKACIEDGCQHYPSYQDSGSNELCGCHYNDEVADECVGQPGALPSYRERLIDAILTGFRRPEQGDPAKDERLVRYMAMVTPLGYQSALTVVQEMTKLLAAENIARSLAEQGETEWVCEWCSNPARGNAWHNDGKLHASCGQPDHGQGWVPAWQVVPDTTNHEIRRH